jgi:hypothetical protein
VGSAVGTELVGRPVGTSVGLEVGGRDGALVGTALGGVVGCADGRVVQSIRKVGESAVISLSKSTI